jgi:hypothetical protein
MSNTLAHLLRHVPDSNLADFNYPATAYVEVVQVDGVQFHKIRYNGAPSTLFANAPNGSELIDATASTGKYYIKTGTIGMIDGTWKYVEVKT